jgi:tRNA nucleotidyltransferase (CCA-adding enzyme)
VRPANIAEDLSRRDFTVNALAIALGAPRPGELIAAPNALEDLAAGRLRVLHSGSFVDDPTRLLRLARYASRLGFEIEARTRELAARAIRSDALGTLSGPRLGAELRLLAREADPLSAFVTLGELELDDAVQAGFGLHDPAVAAAALELLPSDGRRDLVVLSLAFCDVRHELLAPLLDRLAFPAPDRDVILAVRLHAAAVARALEHASSPSQIAEALRGAAPELAAVAGALGAGEQARAWLHRLRHVELEVTGADLLDAGISAGPALGAGLRAALRAKLDGATAGREDELEVALKAARASG